MFEHDPMVEIVIRLRNANERLDEALTDLRRELARMEQAVGELTTLLGKEATR